MERTRHGLEGRSLRGHSIEDGGGQAVWRGAVFQTKEVWVYDYRTNVHHTLKQNPLKASDLAEFVACYNPENRFKRKETWSESNPEGRWRKYTYEEILQREKTSLDIKWLKDDVVTPEDYTLGEVFDELEKTRKSVTEAIANLKRMAKGVRE